MECAADTSNAEFAQSRHVQMPTYSEAADHFSRGPFRCTVTIPDFSDTVFGADAGSFTQKAQAKKAAAMAAVLWLRSRGLLAVKKRRILQPSRPSATFEGQFKPTFEELFKPSSSLSSSSSATKPDASPSTENAAQQLHWLANSLGFFTPSYRLNALGDGWWQVSAHFDPRDVRAHPELAEVGKIDRVFGKSRAKEQCAQIVVRLLEEMSSA